MSRLLALALAASATPVLAQVPATPPVAAPDPARLAIAQDIVGKVMPAGTYKRILQGTLNGLIGNMMDQMIDMPVQQFVASAGLPPEDAQKLGSVTTRQIMAIIDPAFEQRTKLAMTAMMDGMGEAMVSMEPDIREGLAEAYATRFTAAQLGEIKAFYNTPTGSAFAAQQLTIMTDPSLTRRMQAVMPAIAKAMPDVIKRVQAATASLPKPKKFEDLNDADKARLAQLLNLPPDKLKQAKEPK